MLSVLIPQQSCRYSSLSFSPSDIAVCLLSPAVTLPLLFLFPPSSPLLLLRQHSPGKQEAVAPRHEASCSSPTTRVFCQPTATLPLSKHPLPPTRILHLLLAPFCHLLVADLHISSCLILSVHPLLLSELVTSWL